MFYSNNGGKQWSDVSGNLEEFPDGSGNGPSVRTVEILNRDSSPYYFAGTSVGVFVTNKLDGLDTVWEQSGATAIGNVQIDMIDSRDEDGLVVVATHGNGIYSTRIMPEKPTDVTESDLQPEQFAITQNYPNPFNPITTIRYMISISAFVGIPIYNQLGQEIRMLVNESKVPGEYRVIWDGKDIRNTPVSSGVYFYRLEIDGRVVDSKKMLLVR